MKLIVDRSIQFIFFSASEKEEYVLTTKISGTEWKIFYVQSGSLTGSVRVSQPSLGEEKKRKRKKREMRRKTLRRSYRTTKKKRRNGEARRLSYYT